MWKIGSADDWTAQKKIDVESMLGHALTETIETNPGQADSKDKTGRRK